MKILLLLLFYLIGFADVFGSCYMIKYVFRWKIRKFFLFSAACGTVTFLYRLLPYLFGAGSVSINEYIIAAIYVPLIWLVLTDRSFKSLVVSLSGYVFTLSTGAVMLQPINMLTELIAKNTSSSLLIYLSLLSGSIAAVVFVVFIGRISRSRITEPMSIWNIIFIALLSYVMMSYTMGAFVGETDSGSSIKTVMVMLLVLAFLSVAIVMTIKLTESRYYSTLNSINESYLNAQKDYYEIKQTSDTEIKRIRHDMKNHLICIRELASEQKYDELESYINEISEAVKDADRLIHTGSGIVDAIVNEKAAAAKKAGIRFEWEGTISGLEISAVDSCTLVSNLLDNAIEACSKVDVAKRFISLGFRRSEHYLFMTCENSTVRVVELSGGKPLSTKSDKANHGFGLENVERCIVKYGGELQLTSEEREGQPVFVAQSIIPL